MRHLKQNVNAREQASALIITMLVIFVITISIALAVTLTTSNVRQTDSSRDFSALRSATEGALDFGYGVWTKTINSYYAPVSNSRLTTALGATLPVFPGFSYVAALQLTGTDQYGTPYAAATSTATPPPTTINLDNYPGWVGATTSYLASARMSGTFIGNRTVQYGAKRTIDYTVVPLFQATAFFEDDLELFRPVAMTIGGLVHTNSKAYVASSSVGVLNFSGHLSYATNNGYLDDVDPPQANLWSGWVANGQLPPTYSNGGKDQQVSQVNRIEPLGTDSKTLLNTTDTNRNNDTMRELIEPPDTYVDPITQKITTTAPSADPQPIADRRLYNKAGIRIRVSGASYTITTANGTTLSATQTTALKSSLTQKSVYDRREAKTVDITTLDIAKAKAKVSSTEVGPLEAANFNNILYIDDLGSTGYTDPKAIRLINGSILPADGLTVASQNSIYIQGDYNTTSATTRGSAAVFADAVTILSNGWNDANAGSGLSSKKASNTTVNAAIVAGFLPSGWVDPKTGAQYGYSGGLNNFPRFLEDWTGKTFTYTGSMIELFTSQIATGQWDTGTIYQPPIRVWNFDSNFVGKPPPGSLDAVSIGRGPLVRF
jgi:hypothetical protein